MKKRGQLKLVAHGHGSVKTQTSMQPNSQSNTGEVCMKSQGQKHAGLKWTIISEPTSQTAASQNEAKGYGAFPWDVKNIKSHDPLDTWKMSQVQSMRTRDGKLGEFPTASEAQTYIETEQNLLRKVFAKA